MGFPNQPPFFCFLFTLFICTDCKFGSKFSDELTVILYQFSNIVQYLVEQNVMLAGAMLTLEIMFYVCKKTLLINSR